MSARGCLGDVLFAHEADLADNLRRFPLAARYRLDRIGMSLTLADWQCLSFDERKRLCVAPVASKEERAALQAELAALLHAHGRSARAAATEDMADFEETTRVPETIQEALATHGRTLRVDDWQRLPVLARFALAKLTRAGHDNRRLPALLEDLLGAGASDRSTGNPT